MPRILERPSPNFDDRNGRGIDMLVIHYTGMRTAEGALRRLTDPAPTLRAYSSELHPRWVTGDPDAPLPRVSCHYVIDEAGEIIRLVPETARAWHAGVSHWAGEDNLNACSIGIELVNGGEDFGLPAFPDAQIDALCALGRDIIARHGIPPRRVLGHQDIAPLRKRDPGPMFPWGRLAAAGVGFAPTDLGGRYPNGDTLADWLTLPHPGDDEADAATVRGSRILAIQNMLRRVGYGLDETRLLDPATSAAIGACLEHWGGVPRPVGGEHEGIPQAVIVVAGDLLFGGAASSAAPPN